MRSCIHTAAACTDMRSCIHATAACTDMRSCIHTAAACTDMRSCIHTAAAVPVRHEAVWAGAYLDVVTKRKINVTGREQTAVARPVDINIPDFAIPIHIKININSL
jgi:hypothetical protein